MQKRAIDASTAAKWQLSEEPEAEQARGMLQDYAAEQVAFIAPKIWRYEIANVLNKVVSTRRLTEIARKRTERWHTCSSTRW